MPRAMIEFVVESAFLYAVIGLVFAIAFAWRGAGSVDAVARNPTLGFRIVVVPGAALLWPLLAVRWWRSGTAETTTATTTDATTNTWGGPTAPGVPGDRTDQWSAPCERLRGRALAMWCVLLPVLAAVLAIALLARDPAPPVAPDADRLPASSPTGAAR